MLARRSADPDGLEVAELADAVGRQFAPVAGVLDAPEREAGIRPYLPVHADESRLHRGRAPFGPAGAVIRARDEADAIRLANASVYGLGGAVWSRDRDRAERVAAAMETGFVSVNGQVRSDSRLPFGGVKQSGYGRELAEYGLREFVNVKTVVVR